MVGVEQLTIGAKFASGGYTGHLQALANLVRVWQLVGAVDQSVRQAASPSSSSSSSSSARMFEASVEAFPIARSTIARSAAFRAS